MPTPPPLVRETVVTPQLAAPILGRLAPTPYNFEFTGEDVLKLSVVNAFAGISVAIHFRLLDRKGRIVANRYTFVPTTDRSLTTTEFGIGEGYLLNVSVFTEGVSEAGGTYVRLQVIRGRGAAATVLGTIVQGYVTTSQDLAWPGSPIERADEGAGYYRIVTGTTPAAGSTWSETVPTGATWEPIAIACQLVASAAVATRSILLSIQVASGEHLFDVRAPSDITAGQTGHFFWAPGASQADYVSGTGGIVTCLPIGLRVIESNVIQAISTNLQAGDQYSEIKLSVRERFKV
jgi:hypothetical protein